VRVTPESTQLLLLAAGAVVVLVVLIAWLRLNAFLALLFASMVVGLGSQMDPVTMLTAFEKGMGGTLGGIAGVLGLGTIYAGLLAASGGADVLAKALIRAFGPKRVHWALMTLALCIGFTTWFAVGLVMLVPILLTLAKETKEPFLKLAIPLLAVLSIMHGVMPPHPGPVFAVKELGADLGKVILWGLVAAVPVAAVSGPIFARWAVRHVRVEAPEPPPVEKAVAERPLPSLGITVAVLVVPIALLLVQTIAELFVRDETQPIRKVAAVIGNPTLALGISVIFAGLAFRFTRTQALKIGERAIAAVGMTLLVVGGGGGFKGVLEASGAAKAIGDMATVAGLSPMLFGWVCAALVRVATGSATVAIQTACVFAGPVILASPEVNRELVVVGIGCGSLFLSHLNDAGFWIVKETLGMSVAQTLRTWTVTETLVGVTGLFVAWGLDSIF
jgi:GntP family gluconate:H+ symporter